jgi:hypothetical protein
LHPENEKYESKVDFYSGRLAEAEWIAKKAEVRRKGVQAQFSA